MYPLYYVASSLIRVLLATLIDGKVSGREMVPRTGPLILVSNHINNVDPPVLSACFPRRIVFMAKEELYYARDLSGLVTRGFGAFPVRRGEVDRRALKHSFRVLEKGLTLGLFPEGTRSPSAQMQQAQLGTAWIALESGAAIQPVAICGTEGIRTLGDVLARPHIRVSFGKPFNLPAFPSGKRSAHLAQATQIIMESVAALLPPQYRGVYGGAGVET